HAEAVQPVESIIFTQYLPGSSTEILLVVSPVDHAYWNGPFPFGFAKRTYSLPPVAGPGMNSISTAQESGSMFPSLTHASASHPVASTIVTQYSPGRFANTTRLKVPLLHLNLNGDCPLGIAISNVPPSGPLMLR